jgi:hypothetical protein
VVSLFVTMMGTDWARSARPADNSFKLGCWETDVVPALRAATVDAGWRPGAVAQLRFRLYQACVDKNVLWQHCLLRAPLSAMERDHLLRALDWLGSSHPLCVSHSRVLATNHSGGMRLDAEMFDALAAVWPAAGEALRVWPSGEYLHPGRAKSQVVSCARACLLLPGYLRGVKDVVELVATFLSLPAADAMVGAPRAPAPAPSLPGARCSSWPGGGGAITCHFCLYHPEAKFGFYC